MTANMPDEFDYPLMADAGIIAPTRVVDVQGEVGSVFAERPNRLYGAGCRPALSLAYDPPLQNPSTTVIWSPYVPYYWGPDRADWTIDAWGEYIELEVVLYNTIKVQLATTGTMTVGATAASMIGTWASITAEVGYIRFAWRENPASTGLVAKLHSLRVLPDVLSASDLP